MKQIDYPTTSGANKTGSPRSPYTLKEALKIVRPYAAPNDFKATYQVVTSFLAFAANMGLMFYLGTDNIWILLPLMFSGGLLMMRLFTLQHDCGHGSLFSSRRMNDWIGSFFALLTLTPYQYWKASHAIHHATTGLLDKRGTGDIETKTIDEYLKLPLGEKIFYRLIRNPFFLFGIGGILHFLIKQRFPILHNNLNPSYLASVHKTNLVMLLLLIPIHFTYGIVDFMIIYIPTAWMSSAVGFWLFYVQHSYEDAYWKWKPEWDYLKSAFEGSSYLELPPILRWLSSDIGIHHIHHLLPSIPNYNLRKCFHENPDLCKPRKIGFKESFSCLWLALWDEQQQKLVPFSILRDQAYMTARQAKIQPAE